MQDRAKLERARTKEAAAARAAFEAHRREAEAALAGHKPTIQRGRGGGGARDLNLECFSVIVGGQELLRDVSLVLSHGRRYGLVGRNGAGTGHSPFSCTAGHDDVGVDVDGGHDLLLLLLLFPSLHASMPGCLVIIPACSCLAFTSLLPHLSLPLSLSLSHTHTIGKSSFLRALAGGEVPGLPPGTQVLHVEQEVAGDDTSVLQARRQGCVQRGLACCMSTC